MRSRLIVGALLLFGLFSVGTFATRGDGVAPPKQWALANFSSPVLVGGQYLMGPYLITHDDAKMARGEACTTFYRFEPGQGPKEAVISFHCRPVQREVCVTTTFSVVSTPDGVKRLTEYQFAGDSEGHGIPLP